MRVSGEAWQDSLRNSAYPLDSTGARSDTGFTLPDDLLLDLNLLVGADTSDVRLSQITVSASSVIVIFSLADGTLVGQLDATTAPASPVPVLRNGQQVGLALLGAAGVTEVTAWPRTIHRFTTASVLPHLLVAQDPRWAPGLELPDGTVLTGDVYLVGGRGVWLEVLAGGVRINITGDPFAGRTSPKRVVRVLSGAIPDALGGVNLIPQSATNEAYRLSIMPQNGTLLVTMVGAA
jgi:hypothetical protein